MLTDTTGCNLRWVNLFQPYTSFNVVLGLRLQVCPQVDEYRIPAQKLTAQAVVGLSQ